MVSANEYDLGGRVFLFKFGLEGLGLFFRGIRSAENYEYVGAAGIKFFGKGPEGIRAGRGAREDFFPAESHEVSGARDFCVTDGLGNRAGGYGCGGLFKGRDKFFRGEFGIKVGKGIIALRDGFGGDDHHL